MKQSKEEFKALMDEAHRLNRSQVIYCDCGKVFAACVDPLCYTEADWMRDVRKYVKKGYKVDVLSNGTWDWCDTVKCKNRQKPNPLGL